MTDSGGFQLDLTLLNDDRRTVSTGRLPLSEAVRAGIDEAHARFGDVRDGAVPSYYPALAEVDPDLFGIAVAATGGSVFSAGDSSLPFTIMSIAKPFVLALVLETIGPVEVKHRIGVNATGF